MTTPNPAPSAHAIKDTPQWAKLHPKISTNPQVNFGRPMLTRKGVDTSMIASRFMAGETVTELAYDYSMRREEVEACLRYEADALKHAPSQPRQAGLEGLREAVIQGYESGYLAGHDDTVESRFGDAHEEAVHAAPGILAALTPPPVAGPCAVGPSAEQLRKALERTNVLLGGAISGLDASHWEADKRRAGDLRIVHRRNADLLALTPSPSPVTTPGATEQAVEKCAECGSTEISKRHHHGSFAAPECHFKSCDSCGHQWDHT